jgi:hypothetical protein
MRQAMADHTTRSEGTHRWLSRAVALVLAVVVAGISLEASAQGGGPGGGPGGPGGGPGGAPPGAGGGAPRLDGLGLAPPGGVGGTRIDPSAVPLVPPGVTPPSAGGGAPLVLQPPGAPVPPGGTASRPAATSPARVGIGPLETKPRLRLVAKLSEDTAPLRSGLVWRVYHVNPNGGSLEALDLVATGTGGEAEFMLDPGSYIVHGAFGRAGATTKVELAEAAKRTETMILNAGGLKLNALNVGDRALPEDLLTFDILTRETAGAEPTLVVSGVKPGRIVRLNADTYRIVSRFGSLNAVVRAELTVHPGKVVEATMYHKAARLTLKLVNEPGGEALANTKWEVHSRSGDKLVGDLIGAFPTIVLAEGEYTAVASNQNNVFTREFKVEAGVDRDVEVVAERP